MKKLIFCFVLFLNLIFVGAQINTEIYYKLNLDYNLGEINITSLEIEFSQEKYENYFGFWTADVLDYEHGILNTSFFEIPNKILWDEIDPETGEISGGGEGELDEVSFEIYLPYYENAKEIVIYDESLDEVAKINIGEYSKERMEEKVIDEKKQTEEGFEEKISKEITLTEKLAKYWWIFIIVFVILIIVLFNSLKKKKV